MRRLFAASALCLTAPASFADSSAFCTEPQLIAAYSSLFDGSGTLIALQTVDLAMGQLCQSYLVDGDKDTSATPAENCYDGRTGFHKGPDILVLSRKGEKPIVLKLQSPQEIRNEYQAFRKVCVFSPVRKEMVMLQPVP